MSTPPREDPRFLYANRDAYEWLVRRIQAPGAHRDPEQTLRLVERAAEFAAEWHPGRFADGGIENVAFRIGASLEPASDSGFAPPVVPHDGKRRVLHVTASVRGVGGHTRMVYHWIKNDRSSRHSVAILDQRGVPVPAWLTEAVRESRGALVVIPDRAPLLMKARWLREMARRSADLVMLHHFASDVVPTVALAVPDAAPVAVLNHADHQFWLGSSVADIVVNLRSAGAVHAAERRFLERNTVLPIPLPEVAVGAEARQAARAALGIDDQTIVLLSIGRSVKYRPCGDYDFSTTAHRLLEAHPNARCFVVGETAEGIAPYLRTPLHPRLHFVGTLEDPAPYRAAADVYLESFPFGSQTSLLEAGMGELPIVPAYAPLFPLLVANDDALLDLLPNPKSEAEYRERCSALIADAEQRVARGRALHQRLRAEHTGAGWLDRLAMVYRVTDGLAHAPRPIPDAPCLTTDQDVRLSHWNVMTGGGAAAADASRDRTWALLCHAASAQLFVGNSTRARSLALRAWWRGPHRAASRKLLELAFLGHTGRTLARSLLKR